MTNKVVAAFGGRYYSSLKFYTVVLFEGTSQVYLQVQSGKANKFDITSSVNGQILARLSISSDCD